MEKVAARARPPENPRSIGSGNREIQRVTPREFKRIKTNATDGARRRRKKFTAGGGHNMTAPLKLLTIENALKG